MSVETLLLVIFFVVLPLFEMFRTARQKRQQQQRAPQRPPQRPVPVLRPPPPRPQTQIPPEWTPLPDVVPERPAPPDLPAVAAPVPDPVAVRETMSDKIAARRRSTRTQAVADALLDEAARRDARTIPGVIRGLRSPGGLHRAMVMMAILGPCRAVDPHTSLQSDEGLRSPR